MMVAERSQGDSEELTNQQKRQLFRKKMIVEVRVTQPGSSDERWFEAVITDTNNVGAFAHYLTGHAVRHWHWNNVRACAKTQLPRQSATLGEIVRQHEQRDVPRREPLPAPPQLAAAITPRPAMVPTLARIRAIQPDPEKTPGGVPATDPPPANFPQNTSSLSATRPIQTTVFPPNAGTRPAPILVTRAELSNMAVPRTGVPSLPTRQSKSPEARVTEIGGMIKAERMRRGIPQLDLAQMMNAASNNPQGAVYNSRISRIEFGKALPSDDELVLFAEVLKLDLDQCIAALERDKTQRVEDELQRTEQARQDAILERKRAAKRRWREKQAAKEGREYTPRLRAPDPEPAPVRTPPKPEPVAAKPVTQRRTSASMGLEDLIELLIEIVPMPLDAELRKRWFQCVKELHRLSGAD